MEDSFPTAFIDRINSKNIDGIVAERVLIDKVIQGEPGEFAVILDRISHDAPLQKLFKNLAISGTAVMNNPFWWSADEKFLIMHLQ